MPLHGRNIMNQKGEQGGKVLGDGNSYSTSSDGKTAIGFTPILDTTLTSIASNYTDAGTKLVGPIIPAGVFVAGALTELTVAVGLVLVHYGEE